jgi:hypothetical protein
MDWMVCGLKLPAPPLMTLRVSSESSTLPSVRQTVCTRRPLPPTHPPTHHTTPALPPLLPGRPDASISGGLAAAVPLELRGMWVAHERHGRLPWKRLLQVGPLGWASACVFVCWYPLVCVCVWVDGGCCNNGEDLLMPSAPATLLAILAARNQAGTQRFPCSPLPRWVAWGGSVPYLASACIQEASASCHQLADPSPCAQCHPPPQLPTCTSPCSGHSQRREPDSGLAAVARHPRHFLDTTARQGSL